MATRQRSTMNGASLYVEINHDKIADYAADTSLVLIYLTIIAIVIIEGAQILSGLAIPMVIEIATMIMYSLCAGLLLESISACLRRR